MLGSGEREPAGRVLDSEMRFLTQQRSGCVPPGSLKASTSGWTHPRIDAGLFFVVSISVTAPLRRS
jgi:hypothetical protein